MTELELKICKMADKILPVVNPIRNPDKSIRDAFKAECGVVGTKYWALACAMPMARNPSVRYDDDTAQKIIDGLTEFGI